VELQATLVRGTRKGEPEHVASDTLTKNKRLREVGNGSDFLGAKRKHTTGAEERRPSIPKSEFVTRDGVRKRIIP